MEAQKEGQKKMKKNKSEVLQRIPIDEYGQYGIDYSAVIDGSIDDFNDILRSGTSVIMSVNTAYVMGMDVTMDENGMEKFVLMIAGMLFMMKHNDVEVDHAYGTLYDISDFETGNYNDLFTPEDLELIHKDIKTIKDYIIQHEGLRKEVEEIRILEGDKEEVALPDGSFKWVDKE